MMQKRLRGVTQNWVQMSLPFDLSRRKLSELQFLHSRQGHHPHQTGVKMK